MVAAGTSLGAGERFDSSGGVEMACDLYARLLDLAGLPQIDRDDLRGESCNSWSHGLKLACAKNGRLSVTRHSTNCSIVPRCWWCFT
jgi:hypothetical protein